MRGSQCEGICMCDAVSTGLTGVEAVPSVVLT